MRLQNMIALVLAIYMAPLTVAEAQENPEIIKRIERISTAARCVSINDFAIRQMHTFIMEMEIINPSPNGGRLAASSAMIAMSVNMRLEVFKLYKELKDLGYSEDDLKKIIDTVDSEVISRYIAGYMKSIDQNKAMEFVTNMIKEQQACADWYSTEIKPGLVQQQGGVDG